MKNPVDLSAFTDPILDELASGEPNIDHPVFIDTILGTNGPILELGCGYGRVTIPLALRGVQNLTGLELCAPSLAYARRKAGDLPIRWIEADIRDFHLNETFSLIFARGGVFNFMLTRPDQEALLSRVREHLADDGLFMFDTCFEKAMSEMVDEPDEVAWYTLEHPSGRRIYASGTSVYDYTKQLWVQRCQERWDEPHGEPVRPAWELTLRYVMPQELEALLHYNGFQIIERYVDYSGEPETAMKSASVYICKKR